MIITCFFLLSSLFLFVFDDNCVTCHTGANVIPCEDEKA